MQIGPNSHVVTQCICPQHNSVNYIHDKQIFCKTVSHILESWMRQMGVSESSEVIGNGTYISGPVYMNIHLHLHLHLFYLCFFGCCKKFSKTCYLSII